MNSMCRGLVIEKRVSTFKNMIKKCLKMFKISLPHPSKSVQTNLLLGYNNLNYFTCTVDD